MKGVMILFALFSLGSLMPGKHWLIETEDSGDDSGGATKTKSKILHSRLSGSIITNSLQTSWKTGVHGVLSPVGPSAVIMSLLKERWSTQVSTWRIPIHMDVAVVTMIVE